MRKYVILTIFFSIPIFIIWGLISICKKYDAEQEAKAERQAQQDARVAAYHDSIKVITEAGQHGWGYRNKEDRMTSETTYTAFRYSDESVITGGHWANRSSTTATTTTEVVQNRQLYSNKTTMGRMLNGPKSKTTTNTTVTSSSGPEWVSNEGNMVILLSHNATGGTKAIIYCTSGEYNVNFSQVRIRFDKNKPVTFNITPYSYDSNQTNGFIINNTSKFISQLKEASNMLLEDNGGSQQVIFNFQVGGLTWKR